MRYLNSKRNILKHLVLDLSEFFDYVSVLGTDVTGLAVGVTRNETNINNCYLSEKGFVVKVYKNNTYHEFSFSSIDRSNYDEIIETVKNLPFVEGFETFNAKALDESKFVQDFTRKKDKIAPVDKILEKLNILKKEAFKNELLMEVQLRFSTTTVNKLFISTTKELSQSYDFSSAMCYAVVRRGDVTRMNYDSAESIEDLDSIDLLKKKMKNIIEVAVELLDSTQIEPGVYDVITDPSITGLIAHEAFGHGVEMDMFVKERAMSVNYIDKQVASPLVTMHDDSKNVYSIASYFFDDDGVLAEDTVIIEKGILKRGISDATSAMELGTKPTSNGRRESYTRKAYARMTNTYFENGTDKLDDMIKSIKHGYYLVQTSNGMEDPKNWQIQCVALYAREILDGKFSGKIVSPVVMSGYVPDLLKSISMISDGKLSINGSGFCGKGYKEWVRVSDGGTHIKAKVKLG